MAESEALLALKAALVAALDWHNITPSNRAFVERWIQEADDPAFERLGTAIVQRRELGPELRPIYRLVVASALDARRIAEQVKGGTDPSVQASERERAKVLELAQKVDDLVKFCRSSEISGRLDLDTLLLEVSFSKSLASLIGPMAELDVLFRQNGMSLQLLAELHEREASLLRTFASKPVAPSRTRISRDRRGREPVAFMHLMADHVRLLSGTPRYDAVAAITNIAFPTANATAQSVRSACRPTTRSGRRPLPVH
jgi:hypothetical protein